MVIDSGVKHRRRGWRRRTVCAGCGQAWPCFVALLHRAYR